MMLEALHEQAADSLARELGERGVAVLRGGFAMDALLAMRKAAERCFEAVETDESIAEHCGFNCYSHSVPLAALAEFGCDGTMLTAPLRGQGLDYLGLDCLGLNGTGWVCRMEHCWVRKKFAPRNAPAYRNHPQGWHQDGALGVRFPQLGEGGLANSEPNPELPMTELVTAWIPLDACGKDSPGLEFAGGRQERLLHFSELDEEIVRRRFAADEFHAPELAMGDGLVFLNSVLHRTYLRPEMEQDRISVEYRLFPAKNAGDERVLLG
jgi:hypothetical protein